MSSHRILVDLFCDKQTYDQDFTYVHIMYDVASIQERIDCLILY